MGWNLSHDIDRSAPRWQAWEFSRYRISFECLGKSCTQKAAPTPTARKAAFDGAVDDDEGAEEEVEVDDEETETVGASSRSFNGDGSGSGAVRSYAGREGPE
jgi:hypothetical protein